MTTDRRYSEQEVAEIFQRATDTQSPEYRRLSAGEGMTLAELQAIGRDVGIAPELVARAALAIDLPAPVTERRILGFPIGVGRTVELGRELGDEEWERLIVDLRQTFDAKGVVTRDGSLRQWTNGNLHVYLEPGEHGQRLRMRTVNETAALGTLAGAGMAAFFALIGVAVFAKRGFDLSALIVPSVFSLAAAAAGAVSALRLPGWGRRRLMQMEQVAARLLSAGAPEPHDPAA